MIEYYSLLFQEAGYKNKKQGINRLVDYLENEQGVIPTENPVSSD